MVKCTQGRILEMNKFFILYLKFLVIYKLYSGIKNKRLKYFGDVQELIKINKLKKDFAKLFKRDLRDKYLEI